MNKMESLKNDTSKTILSIIIGFIIIYIFTKWDWTIITSLIVGVIGIISPLLSKWLVLFWLKLTWLLSLIIPNILLAIIFYLFLFPLSLLAKMFGKKDPLMLKNIHQSTFRDCNKEY